jgi:hypothetical protein
MVHGVRSEHIPFWNDCKIAILSVSWHDVQNIGQKF